MEPPPEVTANVAPTPLTAFPYASLTKTLGGNATVAPAVPVVLPVFDTICVAALALTVNGALVALARFSAVAVIVYDAPALSTVIFAKVATPFTADRAKVPPRTAPMPPVPLVMASVMLVVAGITVDPLASCTATCITGVIDEPAATALGCTTNANLVARGGAAASLHVAFVRSKTSPARQRRRVINLRFGRRTVYPHMIPNSAACMMSNNVMFGAIAASPKLVARHAGASQ